MENAVAHSLQIRNINSSTHKDLKKEVNKPLLCNNCKCTINGPKRPNETSTQTGIQSHPDSTDDNSCNKNLPESTSSSDQVSTVSSRKNYHYKKKSNSDVVPKVRSITKVFKNSKQHPPNPDLLPPCRVCGKKASGLHYGVNTCEPCKGFFRRSIVKVIQNKEDYTCITETGSCRLGIGKRTMCSYCRYQKCLSVGMSHDAIKIGRYTYNKRTSDLMEVKQLKLKERQTKPKVKETVNKADSTRLEELKSEVKETVNNADPMRLVKIKPGVTVVPMEKSIVTNLDESTYDDVSLSSVHSDDSYVGDNTEMKSLKETGSDKTNDVELSESPQTIDNTLPFIDSGTNTNDGLTRNFLLNGNSDIEEIDIVEAQELVENLITVQETLDPDFRISYDQQNLKQTFETVYELYKHKEAVFGDLGTIPAQVYEEFHQATGIEIDDRKDKMHAMAVEMDQSIRNMITFARLLPGFNNLSKEDQATLLKAGFSEYRFLGLHNRINTELNVVAYSRPVLGVQHGIHFSEFNSIFGQGEVKTFKYFTERLQQNGYTVEEATLVRGIVLTFSDRVKLQNPDEVDKIQRKLVNTLKHFCRMKYDDLNNRLNQLNEKFILLREYANHKKEQHNEKAKWPAIQSHPLVLEMINQ